MTKVIKKKSVYTDRIGYALITPYCAFLLVFALLPIILNIVISFTNYNTTSGSFVGLSNYAYLFKDPILRIAAWNTVKFSALTVALDLSLGLLCAVAIMRTGKLVALFRTFIFLPYVISMAAAAMAFFNILDGYGVLNQIVGWFGIKNQDWMNHPGTAFGAIVAINVWKSLGYNMVVFTAGLLAIPGQLYEAATIDGSNAWSNFWHVTLPMLRPTTFFLFITGFISSFNIFDVVQIMTGGSGTPGGPNNATNTIMLQIYQRGFAQFKMGYASAISVGLLIVVAIFAALNFRFGSKGQDLDLS